jgi:3-oxoacyl-[acyl-carrier-protein] synthase II
MSRVAITGVGIVAPGATGVGEFAALLDSGKSGISSVDRFDTARFAAHNAGLVRDFKAKDFIAAMKLRRMNSLSRFAVAAARMAVDDRGEKLTSDAGLALGTAFGPVQTSVDYMDEYVAKGPSLAPPQLFAESVANAPGSHIAIEHDLRGFNITVTQRESSALAAAMFASTQIVKGTVPAALTGGAEEVNEMVFSVLDRIGALAHSHGTADEAVRPFDRARNGTTIGEGGAVFVLESGAHERAYAYLSGFGVARDKTATISDWGEDHERVAYAIRMAITDAELSISDIDAVFASANSSVRGDRVEYRAIQTVFDRIPPVVATKGYFGEYAAGGALHLASAVLAMRNQKVYASHGFLEGEPEMRFTPTRETRSAPLRHLLVTSLSAGGGIVAAVLSRNPI